jgi:phosphoribosyl 1,2-cyclic phosphate phosphodiesterase
VGALVESAGRNILIDTPPELRLQLLAANVDHLDAVLFTHDHADHTHGVDDVRTFSSRGGAPIPMFGPEETLESLARKFPYVFDETIAPPPGSSKPEGTARALEPGIGVSIVGVEVTPVEVPHGPTRVFGYRLGPLGYVTDAKSIPDAARTVLSGVRVLVLNALFRHAHPTHLSIAEAVVEARRIGAERTFLTHLTHRVAHAELEAELPAGILPAFDGLQVSIEGS